MKIKMAFISLMALLVVGCATAPQTPIALSGEAWQSNNRVGVLSTSLPKVTTSFPGAGCLLCLATASAANSSLTKHVETLPHEDAAKIKQAIARELKAAGAEVVIIEEAVDLKKLPKNRSKQANSAKRSFSSFKDKHNIDQLVVVDVSALGVHRNYSSYVPTGDPMAVFLGAGYMVNLQDNTYSWYQPVNVYQGAEGEWDEKPNFPGLTNAYFQAIEKGKDELVEPFSRSAQRKELGLAN